MTTRGQMRQAIDLWEEFGNTPIDDDDCTREPFHQFEAGTDRFEIWHWIEDTYGVPVTWLGGQTPVLSARESNPDHHPVLDRHLVSALRFQLAAINDMLLEYSVNKHFLALPMAHARLCNMRDDIELVLAMPR